MPSTTKRVLIVAYYFPPRPTAGVVRPSYLASHLPEFGWEPTVLTNYVGQPGTAPPYVVSVNDALERWNGRRIAAERERAQTNGETGHRRLGHRAKDVAKRVVWCPDRAAGWLPAATRRALDLTRRSRFDAIISTCPPPTVHIVAGLTAMRRGLPWIADYRDLWYGNPYAGHGRVRMRIEYEIERRILRRATRITAISDHLIAQQRVAFHKDGAVIPNAYDPAEWRTIEALDPATFSLCYAGMLYDGKRRLDMIFAAVAELRREEDPAGLAARFDVYGSDDRLVRAMATDFGLDDAVRVHGRVDRSDVLRAQREAAVLLIPLAMDPETSHELGSKVFECVGARRPIIAVGPGDSVVGKFIIHHRLGWFASDVAACKAAVRAAYDRFMRGEFEPAIEQSNGIPTARELARQFADQLDAVTEGSTARVKELAV